MYAHLCMTYQKRESSKKYNFNKIDRLVIPNPIIESRTHFLSNVFDDTVMSFCQYDLNIKFNISCTHDVIQHNQIPTLR